VILMTDDVEPVIRGIQKRFRDLSVDVREERVLRYIVKQLRLGRHIDEILQDSYMTLHTSAEGRAELLQNPFVIKSIEEEIHRQFDGYSSATGSRAKDVTSD
jgi:hypothetical protein